MSHYPPLLSLCSSHASHLHVRGILLPQGLCTCCSFRQEASSLRKLDGSILPSFRSRLRCYILSETFPDYLNKVNLTFTLPNFPFLLPASFLTFVLLTLQPTVKCAHLFSLLPVSSHSMKAGRDLRVLLSAISLELQGSLTYGKDTINICWMFNEKLLDQTVPQI